MSAKYHWEGFNIRASGWVRTFAYSYIDALTISEKLESNLKMFEIQEIPVRSRLRPSPISRCIRYSGMEARAVPPTGFETGIIFIDIWVLPDFFLQRQWAFCSRYSLHTLPTLPNHRTWRAIPAKFRKSRAQICNAVSSLKYFRMDLNFFFRHWAIHRAILHALAVAAVSGTK